jgi:hypothetical protein
MAVKADSDVPDGLYGEGASGWQGSMLMLVSIAVHGGVCTIIPSRKVNYTLHKDERRSGDIEYYLTSADIKE